MLLTKRPSYIKLQYSIVSPSKYVSMLCSRLFIFFLRTLFLFFMVVGLSYISSQFFYSWKYTWVDCEQCLLFFRFSKGNARARPRLAAKPREGSENRGWQPEKKKNACLSRLAPSVTRVFIYVSRAFRSWCCDELSDRLFGLRTVLWFALVGL